MELKGNIIFSVIIHASIAVMTFAFAGRHVVLPRFPENYIVVSLLEFTDKKNSMPGNRIGENLDRPKKPEAESQKTLPLDKDERTVSHKDEKIASSEYAMNDPLSIGNASKESRLPDPDIEQAPDKFPGQAVSLQNRQPTGSGRMPEDDYPTSSLSGVRTTMPGNSMEVMITGLHRTGAGFQARGLIDQIRASIEKAKTYPVLARKRKQEGTVVTEFSINAKGLPQDIRIIKSSGYSLLDSAARDTIVKASPFPVIRGTIEVPLTFILKAE